MKNKQYFEIWLDGKPLATAGNNWASAIKWQAYYSKEYPTQKVSIKRYGPEYIFGIVK